MTRVHGRRSNEAGYSLIEMMFTLGILGVLGSMAVVSIAGARPGALGDGAMRVVLSQLNTARELAITQRKNMRVTFTNGNTVSILREEVPGPTLTTLSAIPMEGGLQITTVSNLADTPDAFCLSHRRDLSPDGDRNSARGEVQAGWDVRQPGRGDSQRHHLRRDSESGFRRIGSLVRTRDFGAGHHDSRLDRTRPRLSIRWQRNRPRLLETGVTMQLSSAKGFSLAETVIALGVLATGVIGAAGVLTAGMANLNSSPADVVMTQKATQAIEAVFSARDSHKLTWSQIRNVNGARATAASSSTARSR